MSLTKDWGACEGLRSDVVKEKAKDFSNYPLGTLTDYVEKFDQMMSSLALARDSLQSATPDELPAKLGDAATATGNFKSLKTQWKSLGEIYNKP